MKNNVYGLTSMIINENGDKVKDGTLLFINKERAEEYLSNVNQMQANTNSLIFMKGSVRSHYEHDQWYTVSDTIADFVRTKIRFFVRNIDIHTRELPENMHEDVVLSEQIQLIKTDTEVKE